MAIRAGCRIDFTAYVDAIENDSDINTDPESQYPGLSTYNLNYYQSEDFSSYGLAGAPVLGSNPPPDPNCDPLSDPNCPPDPNCDPNTDPNCPAGGGGCFSFRTAGVCQVDASLVAAGFTTGNLAAWPTGAQLAPPPDGSLYQWNADSGPRYPVVIGFGEWVDSWIAVQIECVSDACPPQALVRASKGSAVFALGAFPLVENQIVYAALYATDAFPSSSAIAKGTWSITYEYSLDGGETWEGLGTARPTAWYVMVAQSAVPAEIPRYDLGLDKVAEYAMSIRATTTIALALCHGIDHEFCYNPSEQIPTSIHILNAYSRYYVQNGLQCRENARLMRYLCQSAGISATVTYYWCGDRPDTWTFFWWAENCDPDLPGNVSFQLQAPREGRAPQDPHFTFHAVTTIANTHYDPSYGRIGLPTVVEAAPVAGIDARLGPSLPMQLNSACWRCNHAYVPLLPCD